MLRLILILIFSCAFGRLTFAATETLEDLNAHLKAKKAELEPFDESKVKVDLESLGLDDVDKKEEKTFSEAELPSVAPAEQKAPAAVPTVAPVQTPEVVEKKVEEIKKPEEPASLPAVSGADLKKPSEKYINLQKKKNLKKRLELERQKKFNAKKQREKLTKFEELRKRYLLDAKEGDEEEKILPRKKDLNPFANDEMPALPILNRYRTAENVHIPIVLTPRERVDLLFNAISINSVSAFNDAYRDVENPNAKNIFGDTILTYSLLMRRYSIAASAIGKGADVNMPNKLGYTPFDIAIELLDFKLLEMLADNKADLNQLDNFGRSYLMSAARVGFLPAVDLFVSRGVDVNLKDKDGFTALAIAYRHKQEVVAQYLLKHGAKTWSEQPHNPKNQSLIKELENRWK